MAMISVMSTSLKVVSMAAVFWASLRRRAIVWRSFVIRTRSSRAPSSGVVTRGTGAGAGAGGGAITGAGAGAGAAAAAAAAERTSPFSTWPRLPLPARALTSIFCSAAIFAADGAGGMAEAAGAGAGVALGASVLAGAEADAAAPPESWPRSAPIDTVCPVSAAISLSTPAPGAFTSSVTLSVSSSTSGSSARTASPAFLSHLPTVASVIDSPSVGTRISIAILVAHRRPSSSGCYGIDRGERQARPHCDRRHGKDLIGEAGVRQDRRIRRQHRLERRLRRRLDDRDSVRARRIGDRPHGDDNADLDPRCPVLAMATHHQRLRRRHVGEERRPRRHELAKEMRHSTRVQGSGEALVEEGLELGEVLRHQARRRRGRGRAPGVARPL